MRNLNGKYIYLDVGLPTVRKVFYPSFFSCNFEFTLHLYILRKWCILDSPTSDAHAAVAQRSPEIKLVQPTNDNFRSTYILVDGWFLNMINKSWC